MLRDLNLKYQWYEIMIVRAHDIVNFTKNFKKVRGGGGGGGGLTAFLNFWFFELLYYNLFLTHKTRAAPSEH